MDADDAIAGAVRALIDACDLDPAHKDLTGTPARVSKLWRTSRASASDAGGDQSGGGGDSLRSDMNTNDTTTATEG